MTEQLNWTELKVEYLPLSVGDICQEIQWMSETIDSTKPYTHSFFFYMRFYDRFNL